MRHRSLRLTALTIAVTAVFLAAGCGSNGTAKQQAGPANLKILIASSGDAETKAVTDAAATWASSSGTRRP